VKRGFTILGAALIFGLGVACIPRVHIAHRSSYAPPRPTNIPPDATYIQGPNGRGLWESCAVSTSDINCVIANVSGAVLHNGRFVPYAGNAPTNKEEIVITQKSGDGWVSLANGTYLIPAEHNEASKRYLDFMIGDAKHF
jgi:hypothetical protein